MVAGAVADDQGVAAVGADGSAVHLFLRMLDRGVVLPLGHLVGSQRGHAAEAAAGIAFEDLLLIVLGVLLDLLAVLVEHRGLLVDPPRLLRAGTLLQHT